MRFLHLFTGPEDIGRSPWFWLAFAVLVGFLYYYGGLITEFETSSIAY